jgi:beta-lactamase superfamily II metal-dependent hydrolase
LLRNRLSSSISNHPFWFLLVFVLLANCCAGGLLLPSLLLQNQSASPTRNTFETPTLTFTESLAATQKPNQERSTPTKEQNSVSPTITVSNTPVLIQITSTPQLTFTPTIPTSETDSTSLLKISFINVGQGDSILIVSPQGEIVLIDGGSKDSGVVASLQKQGVGHIDLMIATHPHEDHIGGLIQVLETMPVSRVVTNGEMTTTSTYEHFLDAITSAKAEYGEVKRGDQIQMGDLSFEVLNPLRIERDNPNHNSLVLKLKFGSESILFTGDADKSAEEEMIAARLPLKANILKIGHHGSCISSSASFIDSIMPEVAVYSAGIDNNYGHPCPDTLKRFTDRNIMILGTDVYGTIEINVTNDGYAITDSAGKLIK